MAPKLLVTGFGPFPGAPENPTQALIASLADAAPQTFGAAALEALALPTNYRRSWEMLEQVYADFAPDVVVHFGLSQRTEALHVERLARNAVDPAKPDAVGYAPASGRAHDDGPDLLHATLPVAEIVDALTQAGHAAALSDDAGGYVCNATLYRSLHAAPSHRRAGFIHVPPEGEGGFTRDRLLDAAGILLKAAVRG